MNRIPASPLISRGLEIAERVLGMDELSRQLGAPDSTIRTWRMGHASMPDRKFLKLVDILTDLDPNWSEHFKQKP